MARQAPERACCVVKHERLLVRRSSYQFGRVRY